MARRNGKYMDDYNYHDWSDFMVSKPSQMPKGPHFAAVLFDTRNEYSPPYDRNDTGSSYSVEYAQYFAFPDKETLQEWLLRAMKDSKKFFFFEVKQLGEVKLNVSVSVDIDDGNSQQKFGHGRGE